MNYKMIYFSVSKNHWNIHNLLYLLSTHFSPVYATLLSIILYDPKGSPVDKLFKLQL